MANIKVSEMTEATSFDDGDYTMIVQANQNKKISKENMLSDIPAIQNNIITINNNIGNLTSLETDDKTSVVNSINELKNAEIYSTSETKTNEVWIDGKSIYKKTIVTTEAIAGTGGKIEIPHEITNYDKIWIDLSKSFFLNLANKRSLPIEQTFYTSSESTDKVHAYLSDGNLYIVSNAGWNTTWEKVVTILYTKEEGE